MQISSVTQSQIFLVYYLVYKAKQLLYSLVYEEK